MDYEQFKTYVKESMEAVTGEHVEICPIVKNNSVIYDGLSVQPDGECIAVPTIYLGQYYESYQNGTPAPELVRDMVNFYEAKKCKVGIDPSYFHEFSWLKDKIGIKLINRHKNEELLRKVPHQSYLDLEIVYYLIFWGGAEGDATMLIEDDHLKMWGVSQKELHETAMMNMPKMLPPTFRAMDSVMQDIYQRELEMEIKNSMQAEGVEIECGELERIAGELVELVKERQKKMPMYVISNVRGVFGAAALLYSDYLMKWAEEIQCDLFVIPSSIHEVLVLPAEGFHTREDIIEMVKEINRTQVAPEEVLSDHVYIYHRKVGKITM